MIDLISLDPQGASAFMGDSKSAKVVQHDRGVNDSRQVHAETTGHAPAAALTSELVRRTSTGVGTYIPAELLTLQRTIGNRNVATLLQHHRHAPPPQAIQRTPHNAPTITAKAPAPPRIQRNPIAKLRGIGRTKVFEGNAGGKQSQEKAFDVLTLSPEDRATRLVHVLSTTYSSNKSRFEDARMALTGGGNIEALYQSASGGGDLRQRLTYLFGKHPLRLQYVLEILDKGEPSQWLQLAEKVGALDSYLKSGRTVVDMATRDNVMAFVQSMSYAELKKAYETFPGQLRRAAGRRGMAVIESRLNRQKLEDQMSRQGQSPTGQPANDQEKANQQRLVELYDQEAASMVRMRRSKLQTSKGLDRIKGRKGGLRKSTSTDTTRIVKELRDWCLDKDPEVIKKLTEHRGRLHHELRWAFGLSFSTLLSKDSVNYVYEMMLYPDTTNPEHAVKQIEAVLNRRIGSVKVIRWAKRGATSEIEDILEQVDPEDMQRTLGRDGIEKLGKMSDEAMMDFLWQKSPLHSSPHRRRITHRLRHGEKAKKGGVYDRLWQIADSKVKQADFLRVSQRIVNIIQRDLDHSTPDFELVRQDGWLLRRIKAITSRLPGTRDSWSLITKILGIHDDVSKMQEQSEFKYGSDYEADAKTHWASRDMQSKAEHWAARIDGELGSVISRPSTVLMHIYSAQEDADEYAGDPNQDPGKSNDEKYKDFMQAVGKAIVHKFGIARFRGSFWDPRRRGPTIRRIKEALSGDPAKRLTIGELLNATKGSFGKIRTDSTQVANIINLLSGQELLYAWTNFKTLETWYTRIKAMPATTQKEQDEQQAQKQGLANQFLLSVRPEFWDQKLEKYGMGAFGEVEKGHVTFRDLLKRSKRVDMERKLLERIADKAEGVDKFKEMSAWLLGVDNEPNGEEVAAKYFANRTRGVAKMQSAQLLGTGAQWSFFSTSSTEYKGTQAQLAGVVRQGKDIDLNSNTTSSQQRLALLEQNVKQFKQTGQRLDAEEEHFRAIQKTYNARVKTIISTIGAIISTTISAAIAAATWGAGAPILFASLTTSLIAILGSLATAITVAGSKYFTQGKAYSHLDTARDVILTTLQSLIKAGVTFGTKAFTGGLEDILGVVATQILVQLINQLGVAATKDSRNVLERWFETSNFADFAQRMEDEILADVIQDLKTISTKVGMKAVLGGKEELTMLAKGEERPEESTTSWERFTKGDSSKDSKNMQERMMYALGSGKKHGMKTAKKKRAPLVGALTSYVDTSHDMYISKPGSAGSDMKGSMPRNELEDTVNDIISDAVNRQDDIKVIMKMMRLPHLLKRDPSLLDVRFKNLSKQGLVLEVHKWIEEQFN
jgi:hypothetical protein